MSCCFFFWVGGSSCGLKPCPNFPFLYLFFQRLCNRRPLIWYLTINKHLSTLKTIWLDVGVSSSWRFMVKYNRCARAVQTHNRREAETVAWFRAAWCPLGQKPSSSGRGRGQTHTNTQRNAERLISKILKRNCPHQQVPMKLAAEGQLWSLPLRNTRQIGKTSARHMTRGPDGIWQTLHIHFTQFNSKISKILNKIYLAVEGHAKLTPVTRLRVCSHNFPQLTAGQIISGGGSGGERSH